MKHEVSMDRNQKIFELVPSSPHRHEPWVSLQLSVLISKVVINHLSFYPERIQAEKDLLQKHRDRLIQDWFWSTGLDEGMGKGKAMGRMLLVSVLIWA
jgi:hypothetical protein